MNAAIIRRTARDTAMLLAVAAAGIIAFEIFFVQIVEQISETLPEIWRRLPFVGRILHVLAGVDIGREVSVRALLGLGFVHPLVLAITWGYLIAICTNTTVGEIDRGTTDLLLTLPLSRQTVYVSNTVVWVAGGTVLAVGTRVGMQIGTYLTRIGEQIDGIRMWIPVVNLLILSLAVGGTATLVGTLCVRRGQAVGIVVGIVLLSFMVNFLEAFLPAFGRLGFLGFLHYYRPVEALRDGTWPLRNLTVLGGITLLTWLLGLWRFSRRDIPAA